MLLLKTAYKILNTLEYEVIKNGDIDIDDHCLALYNNYIVYVKMSAPHEYYSKNLCSTYGGFVYNESLDFENYLDNCSFSIKRAILLHKTKDLNEIIEMTKQLHFLCNSYRNFKNIQYDNKKAQIKIDNYYLKATSITDMFKMIKKTRLLSVLEYFKTLTDFSSYSIMTRANKVQYVQINFFLYSLLIEHIEIVNV